MPIEDSFLERARREFHRHFAPHRHSSLLAAIVILFAVRPLIGDNLAGSVIFNVALVLLLLVALYNINIDELVGERDRLLAQSRRQRKLGWALGVLAMAAALERLFVSIAHSTTLVLVGSIGWLLLFVFVTLSQLRSLLKQREVTGETICMAISVYLMLGFSWTLLYAVMFQLHPDSFGGLTPATPGHPAEDLHIFPVLAYYSLTTLSTIGFGDITPLTLQARYTAVAEGITGQFYMAILVARLVGLQMSRSTGQHIENEAPVGTEKSGRNRDLALE